MKKALHRLLSITDVRYVVLADNLLRVKLKVCPFLFVVGLRYTPFTTFRDARRRHGLIRRVTVP
jgi:hypothetical protein